ncbi:MAG: hypothetical protein ACKO2C_05860 [Actinomycetes bacterium]
MTVASPSEPRPDAPEGTGSGSGSGSGAAGLWWLTATLLLLVLGAVLPLVIAGRAGALHIPRSDDWSYLTTLFRWTDGNGLDFNNWVSMTLVGQLALAAPVAGLAHNSIGAVRIEVALIGVGGLLATYWLGVQVIGRRGAALLVAATVALGPLWGPLAATFMTDVPTFAIQTLAAAIAVVGLRRPERRTVALIGAVAIGFLGISIRQYAVVPVGAILLAYALVAWRTRDRRLFVTVLTVGGAVVVATGALLLWWSGIPHPLTNAPIRPTPGSLREALVRGIGYGRLVGLLLAPVIVWAGPVRIVRRAWAAGHALTIAVAGIAAVALAGAYGVLGADSFVGNYVHPRGVLGDDVLAGFRPLIMPTMLWRLVVLAGSLGAIVLALAVVPWLHELPVRLRARDLDSVDPIALMMVLTLVGLWCAYLLTDTLQINRFPIFDRYALGGLPLVAVLLLRSARDRGADAPETARRIGTAVALVLLAALGLTFTIDSAHYDATRWRLGLATVDAGYPLRDIDGGFEWVAWHDGRARPILDTVAAREASRKRFLAGRCVTIAVNPTHLPPADRLIAKARYTSPLRSPVWIVAGRNARECRIPPRMP